MAKVEMAKVSSGNTKTELTQLKYLSKNDASKIVNKKLFPY